MLTFCQRRMAFLNATSSDRCAIWTSRAKTSATIDCCLPFTATLTPPPSLLTATNCKVMRAALVLHTPLRNQMGCLCGQGVVLADLLVCTEGTPTALPPFPARPAIWCCQPVVWMAIWTLGTGPPDLDVGMRFDDSVAKVSIVRMVPLALQKRAEEADVWARLLIQGKSCDAERSGLRQAALYWQMYAKA